MNVNESITELFNENNVVEVLYARPEKNSRRFFMQLKQLVVTSNGRMNAVHQSEGDNFAECLEAIKKQVSHTSELQSELIKLRPNG